MCGRFTQHYTWADIHAFLDVFRPPRDLKPRYNIAPTGPVDVVRLDKVGQREIVSMRWGLVPFFWKKSLKELPATFNARAETVVEKPMFRDAFKARRCIIPASGFFEWTGERGQAAPPLHGSRQRADPCLCRPVGSLAGPGQRRGTTLLYDHSLAPAPG